MRSVPKGWNWQDEIYCPDSTLTHAYETERELEEIAYGLSATDN